jgi:hypothetical protein
VLLSLGLCFGASAAARAGAPTPSTRSAPAASTPTTTATTAATTARADAVSPRVRPRATAKRFVTRVSRNGRYFLDQFGHPILVKGDSPWAILVDASRARMDSYVATRRSQGFNTVLVSLLGNTANGGPADNGRTYDGKLPFVGGNPRHLANAYWDRVAHFIRECRSRGITVMAYPIDGWTGTAAYHGLARSWSTTTAKAYGRAVANRLKGYRNVIWSVGGDYPSGGQRAADARMNAVMAGLRAGGMNRINTIQFTLNETSLDSSYWKPRVDFSFVYSYAASYRTVQRGYRQTRAGRHLPALMGEAHYEKYSGVTNRYLRSQAAWALTSGSPGDFYGSEDVWDQAPTSAALKSTGARQVSAIRRVFGGLAGWHRLVPDFSSTFITAGRGSKSSADEYFSGNTYVTGARRADGRLAVIYLPDASRRITINQSKMGPGYTARWVNPTNGASAAATERSTYSRTAPHGDGANDWLLVLRSSRAR